MSLLSLLCSPRLPSPRDSYSAVAPDRAGGTLRTLCGKLVALSSQHPEARGPWAGGLTPLTLFLCSELAFWPRTRPESSSGSGTVSVSMTDSSAKSPRQPQVAHSQIHRSSGDDPDVSVFGTSSLCLQRWHPEYSPVFLSRLLPFSR